MKVGRSTLSGELWFVISGMLRSTSLWRIIEAFCEGTELDPVAGCVAVCHSVIILAIVNVLCGVDQTITKN